MKSVLEKLTFAVFEFVLVPEEKIVFPPFKGNVFRGALGKTLRNLTCASRLTDCKQCLIRDYCIYSKVFESFNIEGKQSMLKKVEKAPHPFIIYVPDKYQLEYPQNQNIHFYLTIIGDMMKYISYFILAFIDMGERGIGKTRTRFSVKEVRNGTITIYNGIDRRVNLDFDTMSGIDFMAEKWDKDSLTISLATPLRIKFDRRIQKRITFEMIVRNLLRRIYLLTNFYCNGPDSVDFKDLISMSGEITLLGSKIYWQPQVRFSYRQNKELSMGGVSGMLEFGGDFNPFVSFLRIGEYIHLGKGTAFGLGKIKIF